MKIKKLLFYLLAGLLGGCVPVMSLHPLYTKENIIFEEKLMGTWVDDSNDTTWEFKRVTDEFDEDLDIDRPEEPEKTYKLSFSENEKSSKGSFFAHLVKLDNNLFLDIHPTRFPFMPENPNDVNEGWVYNMLFFTPVHTFVKIDSIEPQLKLRLTNYESLEKLLKKDPNAVKHTFVEDKLILTASTKELQGFVVKYADDSRVFSDEIILSRKEPNEPNTIDPNSIKPKETTEKKQKQ